MRLIYIEATAEEIRENKTLAKTLADTINGFCECIVEHEPVIKAKYEFNEEADNEKRSCT